VAKLSSDVRTEEIASLLEENKQLRQMLEERDAKLAIIESVQEGLASRLAVQAIYDLVGDQIRGIFHTSDVEIRIYDPKTNLIHFPYFMDDKKRVVMEPISLTDLGISSYVLRSGKTIVINENLLQEIEKYGSKMLPGGHPAKSAVFVPLVVSNQVRGLIALGNIEREHAFSESDVRLLETLADSMSTALENARLFDETQRLLSETEQRNAELAIINSIQEGLASKLDVQSIYDLVGDKIRDIFHAQGTAIYLFNYTTEILETPYCFLKQRYEIEARPFSEHPIASLMVDTIRPIMYRTVEEYRAIGGTVLENSEEYKSGMYVPLRVGKELKGMVGIANLDKENAYTESDLRLLQTLANSLSVALENARLFDETQRLLKETEQRNAEFSIINSVQQGLASKFEFQSIIDLVGDQIHAITRSKSISIALYNKNSGMISWLYWLTLGKRIQIPDQPMEKSITQRVMYANQPLNLGTAEEILAHDAIPPQEGWTVGKSFLGVPFSVGSTMLGALCLHDFDHEHAFHESDERLLHTLANSMSVALENARLFEETQRLLKETEQRAAELQIINSVQEGLASKLDMQAIYDLVGDKIRDLFNAQSVWIQIYDDATQTRQLRYGFYKQRLYIPDALPYNKLTQNLIATKKPLVINQDADARKSEFEMVIVDGSEMFRSAVFVPLIARDEAKGVITLQNMEHENAFSESDINLLSTIASSMSVALENARLFDETQRLLKETEQRNAELAIINSVQEGLSSKMDMQAIYELVGDKMQEIFDAQSLLIVAFDHVNELAHMTYNREKGVRYYVEPYPLTGLHRYLIQSRNTVVINENSLEWQSKFGMIRVPGTESPQSMIFVPLTSGYRVSGMISLQNLEREHAFSETDVRLLETLASSMSVALENASLFDETQRLFLEAKEARTAAEQADQAKSAFLSSMSHELRTPLNAIINFVEMVARGMIGPVNQEQVELLDQALYSSKHLLNLINDVLDISKIQAGQLTLFIEDEVSVQVIIETTLSIVGGLLQEKNLQLIRDIDPHLPMISCDRRRLRQVLLNLISNAIKFTDKGTITVSVKNQGQDLLFAVIDTGLGIPPDKQDLIFEPFIQTENGERQLQGTGLGLPISRSLIRAHGGKLWVESEGGEGSAFFFTLPVERRATP